MLVIVASKFNDQYIPFSGLVRIQYHRNRTMQVKRRMRNFMKTVAKSKT
jgi:hypothetical protein